MEKMILRQRLLKRGSGKDVMVYCPVCKAWRNRKYVSISSEFGRDSYDGYLDCGHSYHYNQYPTYRSKILWRAHEEC